MVTGFCLAIITLVKQVIHVVKLHGNHPDLNSGLHRTQFPQSAITERVYKKTWGRFDTGSKSSTAGYIIKWLPVGGEHSYRSSRTSNDSVEQ